MAYATRAARHWLPDGAASDLQAFAMAQIRLGLPWRPDRQQDGRRGKLSWSLQEDRVGITN